MKHQENLQSLVDFDQIEKLEKVLPVIKRTPNLKQIRKIVEDLDLKTPYVADRNRLRYDLEMSCHQFSQYRNSFCAIARFYSLRCLYLRIVLRDPYWHHSLYQHEDFEIHQSTLKHKVLTKQNTIVKNIQKTTNIPEDIVRNHILPMFDYVF